ncbi:MAG: hydroxyacid dehydrogenase [Alphaproteobacteria bacterium]|nr:hydroxyacid dehydrogenase [Alphaproteobacteria bacterium]
MSGNAKRAVYFETVPHAVYLEIFAKRPDISLMRLEYKAPSQGNWSIMGGAHGYQVTSARDDLAPEFFVDGRLLARCPNLLAVSTSGAGYDTVDVDACTAAGVIVVNQSGGNKEAVAEHAVAMMLNLSKRIGETDHVMRTQPNLVRTQFMGTELLGKTVGIIGLGNVGARLAEICRLAFSMRVLAHDPYLTVEQCQERGATKVALDELLGQADIVSINCPRTKETRGMIGAAAFAKMKPGALFVTTARGGIHDEAALEAALKEGRLSGAGLDVWDKEPPPTDHPLLRLANVLASPHTAGVTRESRHQVGTIAAEQLIGIFDGDRPPRLLNPEAWSAYATRYEKTFGTKVKA